MATGGGARGWQFLKRNDHYAEACRALSDPAAAFLVAPFPIRRQTGADLEAGPWGLLGWEDPLAADGPCSPFWAVAPMIEAAPAPAEGPGLATQHLSKRPLIHRRQSLSVDFAREGLCSAPCGAGI